MADTHTFDIKENYMTCSIIESREVDPLPSRVVILRREWPLEFGLLFFFINYSVWSGFY